MAERRTGRIIRSLSGFYQVITPEGPVECRARGILRREDCRPLTGDLAVISLEGSGKGMIEELLPRRNSFIRPAAANLDQLVIFASGVNPVTDPFLIDRVAAIARGKGVEAVICLNKADLDPAESLATIYRQAGFPVARISARTGEGVDELRALLRGKVSALTGNSGVGKSSALNALCPELNLATGEVSQKLGRGRHTTRHVELYALGEDTYVMDTPGFSAFDTDRMDTLVREELASAFPDFAPYLGQCRYRDCTHRREPGCSLRQAVDAGQVSQSRYESYLRLYDQVSQKNPWEE